MRRIILGSNISMLLGVFNVLFVYPILVLWNSRRVMRIALVTGSAFLSFPGFYYVWRSFYQEKRAQGQECSGSELTLVYFANYVWYLAGLILGHMIRDTVTLRLTPHEPDTPKGFRISVARPVDLDGELPL